MTMDRSKVRFKNEALQFLIDSEQVNCKLGDILDALAAGAEYFVIAIKNLSVNEIINAALEDFSKINNIIEVALNKDLAKWSQKIEEIKENQAIICICPCAKIISNAYEEIKLSLPEITDSQIHELMKMFNEHSIKIAVESSSLLVRIIKDTESR